MRGVAGDSPLGVRQTRCPYSGEKTEGPATSLTFLGIQIDTRAMQLSLPQEKLHDLKGRLNHWMQSDVGVHDLRVVIGRVQVAFCSYTPSRALEADAEALTQTLEEVLGEGRVWAFGEVLLPHLHPQRGDNML